MSLTRLFSVAFVAAVGTAAAVVACGGSDNGGGADAKVFLDGHGSGSGSGSGSNNVTALGQHCMPGSGAFAQGDCPGGYVCLNLTGGHDTWCSKPCTAGSGDTCNQGYTGPGEGACIFRISAGSGSGQTMTLCGIVCALNAGSAACPNCNDTCPGALQCGATLSTGSGSAVGSACD